MAEIYYLSQGCVRIVFSSHKEVQKLYDVTHSAELCRILEIIRATKGTIAQHINCNPIQLATYLGLIRKLDIFCMEISGDGIALRFGNAGNNGVPENNRLN
ncbi:MAG TPA: hypothetical protein DIU47_02490 [Candidatus Pacebacteria bacterium]|nr:MAG: hypothetical protein UX00_C0003G0111 [Microgenomates group bacterium GW2011_GWB1_45_17]KKU22934.1 MAG: hypothetical protein UX35_C0013G0011 [Microgenomates group bacterium GW2011_GWA1_46_15]KKU24085.1 MAG: hypothetical protein UX36_C0002G0068 [Microgenomates group bacterium GW2011_GWC1_46_15]HCR92801.1 hypothetical protein [Candidatus Paceibacterota bacterium]